MRKNINSCTVIVQYKMTEIENKINPYIFHVYIKKLTIWVFHENYYHTVSICLDTQRYYQNEKSRKY